MKLDIAFALNKGIVVALLAAMNSVVKNTARPEAIRFNITVPADEVAFFEEQISGFFQQPVFEWRVRPFHPPQFLKDYVSGKFEPMSDTRRVSRHMQYARMFLQEIFEDVTKVLYLDADVVVLGDVAELFDTVTFTPDRYFAAVPHFYPAIFQFGNPFKAIKEILAFKQSFNSGVLFTDYTYWNEETDRIFHHYLDWDAECKYGMLNRGDETLLNVMFKNYIQLDKSWNRCGYGNMRLIAWFLKKDLKDINVIHWSGGHHKPWKNRQIVYGQIWRQYAAPDPTYIVS
ncbi:lipopolysaccharide biosynthesis protein [filamentous cyanobacterium CCP5]|nr:lipopolysaccharide biosynthesis protein [filamentous cyanobacterium CCP5]